ncbi:hypothetical protein GLOIN_2v1556837 [Rhizophagus clarus]|uniref:Uncharacterized protein n=1 Tax=Rhizophagus clarus TaxID=94130 RepID=A0A8H3MGE1_9GLOM|nr:hypothetical protein GLOIN_2v1556837 [Rhizophagus clarus]
MQNYQPISAPKPVSYDSFQQYTYFPARENPFAPPPSDFTSQSSKNSLGSSVIHPPQLHTNKFSYRFLTDSDSLTYQVSCEKISAEILNNTINNELRNTTEHVFFYDQRCDKQIYKVTCKSDALKPLTIDQTKQLEYKLSTYLSDYYIIDYMKLIQILLYCIK